MDNINSNENKVPVGAPAPAQAQTQARTCPHDCGKCHPWQQMYCCTKMVFDLSKSMQEIREEIGQLKAEVYDMKSHLPAKIDEFINPE